MSDELQRWKLTLAYDGAPWQGWQSQANGLGVQDQLESALSAVAGTAVNAHGSGRTDAGVHALAQVAHFDAPPDMRMDGGNWLRALNTKLPKTIRVLHAEPAKPGFHARYDAIAKTYCYRICRGDVLSPFEWRRAWHVHGELDAGLFARCAQALPGTHNFARLSANRGDTDEETRRRDLVATTRTIHRVTLQEEDERLAFEIEGNGFLYKMVRLIVGALVHVARGRESPEWFADLLADPSGPKNHQCAPADGLYLARVHY